MAALSRFSAAIFFLCAFRLSNASTPKPAVKRNPYDGFVGTSCRPPFGFRPNACGNQIILSELQTPAPVFVYGPNTCRIQRSLQVNEVEYEYRKYCDWTYSKNYYSWVQQCQLICQPSRECSNRNQTIETSGINCCEGFRTRPPKPAAHNSNHHNRYFTPIPTDPIGCPIAIGETIGECLMLHNLTRFLEFVEDSVYMNLLFSNMSGVTVLAPTNEAFDLVDQTLLDSVDVDMFVGNHILNGTFPESDFTHNRRFTSVSSLTLHSTLIHFPDYSIITYLSNSNYNTGPGVQLRERRFINGAGIIDPDSCFTDGATLHIIDRVMMPSNETIASILSNDPQFSMFAEALMFAGTFDFLSQPGSFTVFAPTNEGFARDLPPLLYTCLTSFMRVPLVNLILFHVSKQTDYSQVLSLRQSAFTLLTDYNGPQAHLVFTADNGTLFLGGLGNQVPITQSDIPADNGVIHVVERVLMPSDFDYGECQEFVPTTPPPTTQPPTTMPTTMPTTVPTTMPTTVPVTTNGPGVGDPGIANTTTADGGSNDEVIYDYNLSDRNV